MNSRRVLLLVPVACLALILSACSPGTPTAAPTTGSTSSAASSNPPTATPTPTAASVPVVRVQATCAGLFDASTVAGLVSNSSVILRNDGTGDPTDIGDAADRQRGILTCEWGGTQMTDSGYDEGLTITIVPDAAAEFAGAIGGIEGVLSPAVTNTAGTRSGYNCQVENPGFGCSGEMLAGNYWVGVELNTDDGHLGKAATDAKIQTVLGTLATKLAAAPTPSAAWTVPDTSLPGFCSGSTATSSMRSILHSPHLAKGGDVPLTGADELAESESTFGTCDWTTGGSGTSVPQYAGVSILQGGSWLLPILTRDEPTPFYAGKDLPITVVGATEAVLGCGQGQCLLTFSVGDDAYEVSVDDVGDARTATTLAALVAAVSAS